MLALALVAAAAGTSAAAVAPDSAARAALQARIRRLGDVRIVGSAGTVRLLVPEVRDDGLHMRRPWKPPRAALFVSPDVPAPPRPVEFVPWSEISEVQVRRSRPGRGALMGAAFGAGLSLMLAAMDRDKITEAWDQAAPVVFAGGAIVVGAGAAIGALLGSVSEDWRTVYPAPPGVRP